MNYNSSYSDIGKVIAKNTLEIKDNNSIAKMKLMELQILKMRLKQLAIHLYLLCHIECQAFNYKHNVSIPYEMDIFYYYLDEINESVNYKSQFIGLIESPIYFSALGIESIVDAIFNINY